ncbi:MAG TPA: hypothetical protein DCO83_03245 [Mucilaginibacter sp.]|jgi:hypothetical protein|nr:hypothetical protein [Mucilaginibacter sp.]
MKLLNKILFGSLSAIFLLSGYDGFSQAPDKGSLSVAINYFNDNNKIPYVLVRVKTKVNGKFKTVPGIPLKLFLNKDSAGLLIGKVVTNESGEATSFIPPSLKKEWSATIKHSFHASFMGNTKYDSTSADLTVGKAKILIDTVGRSVVATVLELKDTSWTPVKGVDVMLAVKRLGADLNINETATFATDSTGKASGDFKRDTIPGDLKGNITLVAKVVDNDQFGNLSIEKTVHWGSKFVSKANDFNERTLFATRAKAPVWLLFIALGIIIAVWTVLILLVQNILRIKKLGQEA